MLLKTGKRYLACKFKSWKLFSSYHTKGQGLPLTFVRRHGKREVTILCQESLKLLISFLDFFCEHSLTNKQKQQVSRLKLSEAKSLILLGFLGKLFSSYHTKGQGLPLTFIRRHGKRGYHSLPRITEAADILPGFFLWTFAH